MTEKKAVIVGLSNHYSFSLLNYFLKENFTVFLIDWISSPEEESQLSLLRPFEEKYENFQQRVCLLRGNLSLQSEWRFSLISLIKIKIM